MGARGGRGRAVKWAKYNNGSVYQLVLRTGLRPFHISRRPELHNITLPCLRVPPSFPPPHRPLQWPRRSSVPSP